MPSPLPDGHLAAIDILEAAGQHKNKIDRVIRWPGLSPAQRMLCFTLVCLEHLWGHQPTVYEVAHQTGISEEKLKDAFVSVEYPPYEVITSEGKPRFQAHRTLEYGA